MFGSFSRMLMENTQPNPGSSVNNIGQSPGTPWASVVRGDFEHSSSSEAPHMDRPASDENVIEISGSEPQLESAAIAETDNNGVSRKPAWNKPSNGANEPGFVMTGTWPSLSEIARPIQRSMSDSSNGSSPSSSQAPIVTQPPPPPPPINTNDHGSNTTPKGRQRNQNGVGTSDSGQPHNTLNQQPRPSPPPFFPVSDIPGRMILPMLDAPSRGPRPIGGIGSFPSHSVNDHSLRNNTKRGSYGPRPRGDVQYPNNHGARRDQEHRDVRPPPQYGLAPMEYMPSPVPGGFGPYMPHPYMNIFHGQMGLVPEMQPPFIYFQTLQPESFRPLSIGPPPPPMIKPLTNEIVDQINYYFSDANLVADVHLRRNMDDHGWVPISMIAAFPRVRRLTHDISLILESLRHSTVVEVQGDKLRRRNVWSKWLLPPGTINFISSARATSKSAVEASFQKVSLEDGKGQNESVSVHFKGKENQVLYNRNGREVTHFLQTRGVARAKEERFEI